MDTLPQLQAALSQLQLEVPSAQSNSHTFTDTTASVHNLESSYVVADNVGVVTQPIPSPHVAPSLAQPLVSRLSRKPILLSYAPNPSHQMQQRSQRSGFSAGTSPIDSRYLSRLALPAQPSSSATSVMMSPSPSSSPHLSPSSTTSPFSIMPSLGALQEITAGLHVSDRFIPHRRGSNLQYAGYKLGVGYDDDDALQENAPSNRVLIINATHPNAYAPGSADTEAALKGLTKEASSTFGSAYVALLRSEMLGLTDTVGVTKISTGAGERQTLNSKLIVHRRDERGISETDANAATSSPHYSSPFSSSSSFSSSLQSMPPTFRFTSPRLPDPMSSSAWGSSSSITSMTPDTQRLFGGQKSSVRVISKLPYKVLDAPNIRDDFYLNLVDWGQQNLVAVALGARVYLWSGVTGKVHQLLDFDDTVEQITSVAWTMHGSLLAVGLRSGCIQIWDTDTSQCVRTLPGHTARVGSMAWNSHILASGSQDCSILLHDPRAASIGGASSGIGGSVASRLSGHKKEVCGLKWSYGEQQLASGGNDNKLLIWSAQANAAPLHCFEEHTAAVKAIAWSPHKRGLLCSGGGTADRCIRFWSTQGTGASLAHIDTGSQVCNLLWSRTCNEIVSTHGHSHNKIVCWEYPSMQQIVTLTGHTKRVLFLAVSPCGQTILTGSGDETLRFWNLFPNPKRNGGVELGSSLVLPTNLHTRIR